MMDKLSEYEAATLFWLQWCAGALTLIAGQICLFALAILFGMKS